MLLTQGTSAHVDFVLPTDPDGQAQKPWSLLCTATQSATGNRKCNWRMQTGHASGFLIASTKEFQKRRASSRDSSAGIRTGTHLGSTKVEEIPRVQLGRNRNQNQEMGEGPFFLVSPLISSKLSYANSLLWDLDALNFRADHG